LLKRGDPRTPLDIVPPSVPAVLVSDPLVSPTPTKKSTGRRLWLARWMTSPNNPLVARVIVNRIWQHHFGVGLVASANDFGEAGQTPSHPELLDWLASELMAQGWRLKPLHRLICLSRVYQLAASVSPAATERDPDNTLLSHYRQRRLEGEVIRDAILAAAGDLNRRMAGPGVYPPLPAAVLAGQSRPGDGWGRSDPWQASRRSIYIFAKRSIAPPEIELLDAPDSTSSCEQRTVSTIGPQALTFLNGDFVHQEAQHLAMHITREVGADPLRQIERGFDLVFCRKPRPDELDRAKAFLAQQKGLIDREYTAKKSTAIDSKLKALESLCVVLLNANEFFYLN
jgi:hypothetical protein